MTLRSLWNNYLTNGWDGLPEAQLLRLKLINAFSLVGVASFFVFGLMNALGDNAHTGFTELFFALIVILNIVYLRGSGNVEAAATIILIVIIIAFSLLFTNGGLTNTGWLWFYTFPIIAFFLKGARAGWRYLGIFILLLFFVVVAHYFFGFPLAYSYVEIRQFTVSFLAPVFMIYLYVQLSEKQSRRLEEQKVIMEITNRDLKTELKKSERIETALQNQNKFLEKIKTATLNILEDLTEEKKVAETAKLKNAALVESIGEGIIAMDENLCVMTMNPAAEKIMSFNAKKSIGKKFYDLWDMTDETGTILELKDRPIYQALRGKKTFSNKYSYINAAGKQIHVSLLITPIWYGEKIIGVIDAFRDISKEREIDRAKTEFVSLASHQLRTPLSATKWSAELLGSEKTGALNTSQKKLLHNIYISNERMIELVGALLNVSRIDMGTFSIKPIPTDIVALIDAAIAELSFLFKKKKIQLEKKYDQTMPKLEIDPELMRVILQNLLSNALKYTPQQGKITIALAQKEKKLILSIADTGYGIPKNQQEKIFTKLFRADNIRTKETEGTGLGLYIVKSIIDKTDGKIWFESEENKGSAFHIALPLTGMKEKEGTKRLN